jgi:hypothetical protein
MLNGLYLYYPMSFKYLRMTNRLRFVIDNRSFTEYTHKRGYLISKSYKHRKQYCLLFALEE